MEPSENRTRVPRHPPVGETRAPAAAAGEGAHFQNNGPSGMFFGLRKNQLYFGGVGVTPRDYKAHYPPDRHGQEMSANARIWPIYLEEAADFDANMLAEWRDTIDVLLVFAGLFSAVLTTFVVQTSQNMQPDYNQASMLLLFEILKATVSNDSQISIPPSPTSFFSPNRSDEWMNSLWFVSLTLSLITALVAVLVKQWLHQYVTIVSDSSARDRARIRHMRYAGLETWQVPMIIGLLPVLLHVSLALFFAGLAIFLFSLGMKVAWVVSIIGAATFMAYIIALILPLVCPYCPYKVPLTLYIHPLYQHIHHLCQYCNSYLIPSIRYCIVFMRHYPYTHMFGRARRSYLTRHRQMLEVWKQEEQESPIPFRQKLPTLKEIEDNHIQQYATMTDAQSLLWLHSSTSNASVHQSVLQAISGMTLDTVKCLPDKYVSSFVMSLRQQIEPIKALLSSHDTESELVELELYSRALWVLSGDPMDKSFDEQLTMALSVITTEKALTSFLGILQGPQRSSLTLHPGVWKILFDITISSPPLSGSALVLELELMKILASPSTTSEREDPTTIDNPTDEMRGHICDKLLGCCGYDRTQTSSTIRTTIHLGIMLSLIPRIHQRLLDSSPASDLMEVIGTALAIMTGITLVIHPSPAMLDKILETYTVRLSLLRSQHTSHAFDVDIEALACGISLIFNPHQSRWIQTISEQMELSVNSEADSDTGTRTLEHLHYMIKNPFETDIDTLVDMMRLLINGHRERILYAWVHPSTYPPHCPPPPWRECVLGLIRWASGEKFRQWTFLKRVLAIVVIKKMQLQCGCTVGNESLPQYDKWAYMEVNQLPWLLDIYSPGSSSDGVPNPLEYSQIEAHPKFQEFLNS
ncbi:uncharacterized protein ARMOST_15905 [Armillaria ostoyae]|uniref:DUF6535 domain-containing protein n=1 Tax=Armillaria ostoyae TaxID=47428 RepID=A0A284RUP2_ARMOS|nr:uncharacterized protein ARMOST_15905 [Armillaria ostoyae]